MKFRGDNWRIAAMLGLVLIAGMVAGLVLFNSSSSSQASTKQKSLVKSYNGWSYRANVVPDAPNTIDVNINYDNNSVLSLKSFIQSNKELEKALKQNGKTVYSGLITFNQPVSVDEFNKFAAKNKLKLGAITLRVLASNGERWTMFGTSEDGGTISSIKVAENLANLQERDKQAVLGGIIDAEVEFAASQYQELYLFKSVFLVDITPTLAKQEVVTDMLNGDKYKITFNLVHPYWSMEDLGVKHFQ